jgi:transcriptional regulator with XRE-family HTH domain
MNRRVSERIKDARKKAFLSQALLAGHLGLKQQTVSQYERGETSPDYDTLASIARITGKPITWFLSEGDEAPAIAGESQVLQEINKKLDRLLKAAEGAKPPADKGKVIPMSSPPVRLREIDYIDMPIGAGATLAQERVFPSATLKLECRGKPEYAFLARGFSMEPDILDGSLLLVRPTRLQWQNDDICVVFLKETEEMTVKMLRRSSDWSRIRLIGTKGHKDYRADEIEVQGVVEDIVRSPQEAGAVIEGATG